MTAVGQEADVGESWPWVSGHACTLAFAECGSELPSPACVCVFLWRVLCSTQRGSDKSPTRNGWSGVDGVNCEESGEH